ncbi:flagellar basal body P-ring formation chaperone FlgA [Plastorhodobacter daqingensis]|uniref:Flagella basal body P-ring formation protein FlgA n=1 Tax=Plastorhodobacter daqingensis TaxID=1387281 RepID=A0ABW2UG45_9RHOB
MTGAQWRVSLVTAALLVFATSGAAAITGAEMAAHVQQALAAQGQARSVTLAASRRFFPCDHPPEVTALYGWDTVQVRCTSPRAWDVALRTVPALAPVPPATAPDTAPGTMGPQGLRLRHGLRQGAVLAPEDLELAPLAPGSTVDFTDPAAVAGRRLAVSLNAGAPLLARHLERVWLVEQGHPVVIESRAGPFVAQSAGTALMRGQRGDVIRVLNTQSNREIRAIVIADKKVRAHPNMN